MSLRRIEVLFFEGCPNADVAVRRVHEVVRSIGIEADVVLVRVDSSADATALRFLGSPSVRVNGKDVEESSGDEAGYGMRCRVYAHGGRMGGAPPIEWIAAALRGDS